MLRLLVLTVLVVGSFAGRYMDVKFMSTIGFSERYIVCECEKDVFELYVCLALAAYVTPV